MHAGPRRARRAAATPGSIVVASRRAWPLPVASDERRPLTIPVQVAQLDYVGFKVNALLSSSSVSWTQVSATVREASTWWSAIEPQISDVTLKEAMNRTLLGMKETADQKDAKVMHFAADTEVILVDGLETFFTAHPRSH